MRLSLQPAAASVTEVGWFEQSAADLPAEDAWLSAGEAARLARLRFPKRRADWRLGRWTAKRAVALCCNLPADAKTLSRLEIRAAPDGAPEVFFENRPGGVSISLSHRDGFAACAVAPPVTELGCDLELIEPRSDAFVADYFTVEEQALVSATAPDLRPRLVTLLWSAKESALKALRSGLRLDTRCVTVQPPAEEPGKQWHALQARHADGRSFDGWWCADGKFVRTVVALHCWPSASSLGCPQRLSF